MNVDAVWLNEGRDLLDGFNARGDFDGIPRLQVRDLLPGLRPRSSRDRYLAVIRCYVDTRGSIGRSPVMVAGGYLARQQQWERFEDKWRLALLEAKAKEFHAWGSR